MVESEPSAPRVEPTVTAGRSLPRVWWFTGSLFLVTVLVSLVVLFLPSGYLVDAAGNAVDTSELVTFPKGVKTYSHAGGIRFVTVSETQHAAFGQALAGWLDPTSDVFPRREVLGRVTTADDLRFGAVLMNNSQHAAIYLALSRAGKHVNMTASGVFVMQIVDGSPVFGHLAEGDTIVAIDDTAIKSVNDLSAYMRHATIGKRVVITVDRFGVASDLKVPVTIGSTKRDGQRKPYLGIYMETRPNFLFPFDVKIDTGEVGGPSAGLALTLTVINELSPTSITNGNEVAVTGTVALDGSVGVIGGIRQKVAAVRASGARYFLVPPDNVRDARAVAGSHLKIIPVTSLDDAIAKLKALPRLGGEPAPSTTRSGALVTTTTVG